MEPLQVNPGGQLTADQVVGRDREIRRYWQVLERQGLVLTAERRIGKTSIVAKMRTEPNEGFLPIYQDLESVHSLSELVRKVYRAADAHFQKTKRLKSALAQWSFLLPQRIADVELTDSGSKWKPLLEGAIGDVLDSVPQDLKVVFLWDEFPLMLLNLMKGAGAEAAIELLDLLRSLRQQHPARLRFLFTGSVGLHLVLRQLRAQGNANNPINDMQAETLDPLADQDALILAERLLFGLHCPDEKRLTTAEAIVRQVGGFPYFIHHLVDRLAAGGYELSPEAARSCAEELLFSEADPLDLRHWQERFELYFLPREASIGRAVLRAIALSEKGLCFSDMAEIVRQTDPSIADHELQEVCDLLCRDHYLKPQAGPRGCVHDFRWILLKRWWRQRLS